MRREHLSLAEACKQAHVKPATVLRYVGSAVHQSKAGSRYVVTRNDSFRRDLQIPTALGQVDIPVRGSKVAREISRYSNAVGLYLRTGDTSSLKPFIGKTVGGHRGQQIELLTDPDTLSALAQAGSLNIDQLYSDVTGAA
jgi:hypothetical protein